MAGQSVTDSILLQKARYCWRAVRRSSVEASFSHAVFSAACSRSMEATRAFTTSSAAAAARCTDPFGSSTNMDWMAGHCCSDRAAAGMPEPPAAVAPDVAGELVAAGAPGTPGGGL